MSEYLYQYVPWSTVLMYVNVPPIKLCAHCLLCPKYNHVYIDEGIKACGLGINDIEHLPIVDGMPPASSLFSI